MQHQQQPQPQPQPSIEGHPSEAPLNLPPIQYAALQATPSYGAPMPPQQQQHQHAPPYPPQYQQYQPPAPMPSSVATTGQNTVMRFPLPPQPALDARQMSGGRHKKEIKRRTKTGCLTCRKRRIKCDEGVPTCRNCQKSKRECLGYDPIFKQQPSPANIQPAPSIHNTPAASASASGAHFPPNTYGAPQAYPGTGGTFIQAAGLPHGEQAHFESHYGNGTSLDPALSTGGEPSHHMAHHNSYPSALQPTRRVRAIPVDDLFSLNDIPPRYNLREAPPPVSSASQQDLEKFFTYHYAAGLDLLFETTWYSQHGLAHLHRDVVLQDFVLQCVEQFTAREDANAKQTQSLEARLVWLLATMPRNFHHTMNGAANDPVLQELLPRLDVVEHLLTGQYLDPSRVSPPPRHQPPMPQGTDSSTVNKKFNQRSFWHHLARSVAVRDDNSNVQREIDEVLTALRNLLHMLENRDVLYSLAVARHIGGRMPDWHPQRHLVASTNDPNDPVGKLTVAQQFVEAEDQRGTTQVIQRVCSMAIRAWTLQTQ